MEITIPLPKIHRDYEASLKLGSNITNRFAAFLSKIKQDILNLTIEENGQQLEMMSSIAHLGGLFLLKLNFIYTIRKCYSYFY